MDNQIHNKSGYIVVDNFCQGGKHVFVWAGGNNYVLPYNYPCSCGVTTYGNPSNDQINTEINRLNELLRDKSSENERERKDTVEECGKCYRYYKLQTDQLEAKNADLTETIVSLRKQLSNWQKAGNKMADQIDRLMSLDR